MKVRKRRTGEAGHKGGSDYNTDIERMFAPDRQDGTQDRGLYVTRRETEARRTENEVAEAEKGVRTADAGFEAGSCAINITYVYIIVDS